MEENLILNCIKKRRSIRRFSSRQIDEYKLQKILEAGLYAPSAGGRQSPILLVSQNKYVNEQLGRSKRINSNPKMATGTNYISKDQPSIADDPNIKSAFYDAPTVITLFAPKNFLFSAEDCAIAAQNMMLVATSLGVGSCYIGEGWTAFKDAYGQEILNKWNIPIDYYAVMQLLLGFPREEDIYPHAKSRKANRIIRFD